ncbi:alpha/beta hydrolase family protein [Colwellia piezophila]|uniref:alpha/beta hydrolase family protein n=1 Tax=Colwellia piezophila TaxID=211668 RepID=UPI000362A8CA|nr:prolyl oligopeptidase family serine peptidase [Colwellia piezophila]
MRSYYRQILKLSNKYPDIFVCIILLLFAFLMASVAIASEDKLVPLPISAYGSLPDTSQVKLSPSGDSIAMIKNSKGTLVLMTYSFKSGKKRSLFQADNKEAILKWFKWANDDILLVSASYPTKSARSIKYSLTRLYKYDLSTPKGLELLVKSSGQNEEHNAQIQDRIISLLPERPDHILMSIDYDIPGKPSIYDINIRTNKRKRVKKPKRFASSWYADQQGHPRISVGRDETKVIYKLYDIKGKKIRDLWSYKVFEKNKVNIMGFDINPNILYIRALHNGRDAIFKVDLSDKSLKRELVLAKKKRDVKGSLIYSPKTHAVVGISQGSGDDNKTYWDPEYLALKKSINKALPKANNSIISMSKDLNKYVLYSSSKTSAGDYYLGDRASKQLLHLASRYPQINEGNYARQKKVKFKARDGLTIHGYLTVPVGDHKGKQLPAIVLPHGGPMSQTRAGFHYWAQLFANRGYVVFQPNFRGSSGYGYDFEMAAIQAWGEAMQDDLQDAANWLMKRKFVDSERICIGGGSYGGYAALMAAVKHGDTFKCAASFAGVSDLELIISRAQKFSNRAVIEKQIGTDSDKLEAASPVNFAENINIPILLIHGTEDRVVDVEHSRDMAEELEDYDKEFRYVEIEGANHYLSVQKHRIQTLEEMLTFFDKHLK